MIGGGARANQFKCTPTFLSYVSGAVAGVAETVSSYAECRTMVDNRNTPVNYREE